MEFYFYYMITFRFWMSLILYGVNMVGSSTIFNLSGSVVSYRIIEGDW